MTDLLSGLDIPIPRWLPPWIKWYLRYGLEGEPGPQLRRQASWNFICLFGSLNTIIIIIVNLYFSLSLWPAALILGIYAIIFLVQPLIYKRKQLISAWSTTILACFSWIYVTYLLGINSGVYLFLFVVPAVGLIILRPSYIGHVGLATALAVAGIIGCILLIDEPLLSAAENSTLQTILLATSVSLTAAVILAASFIAFYNAERAEDALELEYDRSEMLLRNILPEPIALRLKAEPDKVIADRHEEVTVLFADIVNFTPRATHYPPQQVVELLNRVFSEFDRLVEKYGLEKIKTVGDAYMVVAGIPESHPEGPAEMADFALAMMERTKALSAEFDEAIELRVGIHTGEAVAGVIGASKFAYDIWGDTVNTAARMEAFGVPGRIQVTENFKNNLENRYSFEERGIVDIKGKGPMNLYFLEGYSD